LRLKILKKLRTASLNSEFTGSYKKNVVGVLQAFGVEKIMLHFLCYRLGNYNNSFQFFCVVPLTHFALAPPLTPTGVSGYDQIKVESLCTTNCKPVKNFLSRFAVTV